MKKLLVATILLFVIYFPSIVTGAQFLGPTQYFGFVDSPFNGSNFTYFHLEDFEDETLNTPGVSSLHNGGFLGISYADSVDADDGSIDGSGSSGKALWSDGQTSKYTFTFDASELGILPTHAGVVWTDSNPKVNDVTFEAFGPSGQSLGTIGPVTLGDGELTGQTDEDRFFGVINLQGLSAISLGVAEGTNWELDHLQYGRVVPIPPAVWLFGSGLLGLIGMARHRKDA